jgi:hypothetical protein
LLISFRFVFVDFVSFRFYFVSHFIGAQIYIYGKYIIARTMSI